MDINNWVAISDLHCGDKLGLYPPKKILLDQGVVYTPSDLQVKMWGYWEEFWKDWVPLVCRKEKFGIILLGDITDGRHHGTTHQISQNLADQKKIARAILEPVVNKCKALYVIRGTEAHVGPSAEIEEDLAEELGAEQDDLGQYSRYDLWLQVGDGLVHCLHHIGTTSSNSYEGNALTKELVEEYNEAARWGEEPPNVILRAHRHRHYKVTAPSIKGDGIAEVLPGWQGKTPFQWRIAGARLAPPQFGGVIVRQGDEDLFTRAFVRTVGRSKVERLG